MLLHRTADRVGLVVRLREALGSRPWTLDRANVLIGLIVGIALGARNLRQAELLTRHHARLVGDGASDSTLWRMLGEIDDRVRQRIAKARAVVRRQVWDLLTESENGFPWLAILGRELARWTVIDLDATVSKTRFIVTRLPEGWEPAKFSWQRRRRCRKIGAVHEHHHRPCERDAVLFDPGTSP